MLWVSCLITGEDIHKYPVLVIRSSVCLSDNYDWTQTSNERFNHYEYIQVCRSRIHERTISLRFLAIILRPPIPTVWLFSLPHWQFVSELPTAVRRGAVSLKGLSQDGGQVDFSKTSAPLSLIKAFQMNLILARSISLDSTFKPLFKNIRVKVGFSERWLFINFFRQCSRIPPQGLHRKRGLCFVNIVAYLFYCFNPSYYCFPM